MAEFALKFACAVVGSVIGAGLACKVIAAPPSQRMGVGIRVGAEGSRLRTSRVESPRRVRRGHDPRDVASREKRAG